MSGYECDDLGTYHLSANDCNNKKQKNICISKTSLQNSVKAEITGQFTMSISGRSF